MTDREAPADPVRPPMPARAAAPGVLPPTAHQELAPGDGPPMPVTITTRPHRPPATITPPDDPVRGLLARVFAAAPDPVAPA